MKKIFIIEGRTYGEGSTILGVAVGRPMANRMFTAAKRSNRAQPVIRQHGEVNLKEYCVGHKFLGKALVEKPAGKARPVVNRPPVVPVVPNVSPEFNRAVSAVTPAVLS